MVLSRLKKILVRAGVFAFLMGLWEFYLKNLFHFNGFYGYVLAYFTLFLIAYGISWWVVKG